MPIKGCENFNAADTRFYVEGDMEREAFMKTFGVKAKRIGINGDSVRIEAIANNIATDLLLDENSRPVFIMFDRESRAEESSDLAAALQSNLCKRFPNRVIKVVVPDRDTECWLFADRQMVSKHFGKKVGPNARFEGTKGAEALKKHIGPGLYEKTIDGVRLFAKVRWSEICAKSASAKQSELERHFPNCAWLKR